MTSREAIASKNDNYVNGLCLPITYTVTIRYGAYSCTNFFICVGVLLFIVCLCFGLVSLSVFSCKINLYPVWFDTCSNLLLFLSSVVGLLLASQQLNLARVPPLGPTSLGKPLWVEVNWGELSLRSWQPRQGRGSLSSRQAVGAFSTWGEELPFLKRLFRTFWKLVLPSSTWALVLSSSGMF